MAADRDRDPEPKPPDEAEPVGAGATGADQTNDNPPPAEAAAPAGAGGAKPADHAGPTRFGHFILKRELGRGGQGVVYLAEDTRLGRQLALKLLNTNFAADPRARLRFEQEAAAAAGLNDPGICTVYESGVIDVPYLAMRLIAGESMAEHIKKRRETRSSASATHAEAPTQSGAQTRRDVFSEVAVVEQVARSLHTAHEAGLIHRDIKPANIMIEPGGHPVVLDFGLARDERNVDANLTVSGAFVGTPAYMAPEQTAGHAKLDRRVDVWALGVVLYELLTLTRPFDAPTMEGLLRAIRTGEHVDVRRLNPAITHELAAVIDVALEKDPTRRYATAEALADDLGRARRLEPVRARRAGVAVRVGRWAQRNPAIAAASALVFLSLVTGLVVSLHYLGAATTALAGETAARTAAQEALVRETFALTEARASRDRAEDLMAFMLGDLGDRLTTVGKLDLLAEVARKADAYYAARPVDATNVTELMQRGRALRQVGDVLVAKGDVPGALDAYERARELQQGLYTRAPESRGASMELSITHKQLAAAAFVRNDREAGLRWTESALALAQTLADALPDDATAKFRLAASMLMRAKALMAAAAGDKAMQRTAVDLLRDATKIGRATTTPTSPPLWRADFATALQNYGDALRQQGDLPGALAARAEGLAVFQALAQADPASNEWSSQIAITNHGMALIHWMQKDTAAALACWQKAIDIFRRLAAGDPTNTRRLLQVSTTANLGGVLHIAAHDFAASEALHREALAVRVKLCAIDPANNSWLDDRRLSESALSYVLSETGSLTEARRLMDDAMSDARLLNSRHAPDADQTLAKMLQVGAEYAEEAGDLRAAAALGAEAAAAFAAAADSRPRDGELRKQAGLWFRRAAEAVRDMGDLARAQTLATEAVSHGRSAEALVKDFARVLARMNTGLARAVEGSVLARAGGTVADVDAAYTEALERFDEVLARTPGSETAQAARHSTAIAWTDAHRDRGRFADAARVARTGLAGGGDSSEAPDERVDELARLEAIAGGAAPQTPADWALAGEVAAARGQWEFAVEAFKRAIEPGAASRDVRLRAARAAARLSGTASADAREQAAARAVSWLAAAVAATREGVPLAEGVAAAAPVAVDDAKREAWGAARRLLTRLRDFDPDLAPIRERADFRAAF